MGGSRTKRTNTDGTAMGTGCRDTDGDAAFAVVPRGPFAGRPWADVPALTLHNILNAVDFGFVELDERRVVAIREGLRGKDGGEKLKR